MVFCQCKFENTFIKTNIVNMGKTNCFDLQIDKTDLRPFKMACNIYIAKTLKIGWGYIPTKIDKGQGGENKPLFTKNQECACYFSILLL